MRTCHKLFWREVATCPTQFRKWGYGTKGLCHVNDGIRISKFLMPLVACDYSTVNGHNYRQSIAWHQYTNVDRWDISFKKNDLAAVFLTDSSVQTLYANHSHWH